MSDDPLSQWTNEKLAEYVNATRWANAEIERLNKHIKEQAVFLNGAAEEIARLTAENKELDLGMKESTKKIVDQIAELSRKDHLITELANALFDMAPDPHDEFFGPLISRAQEEAKSG